MEKFNTVTKILTFIAIITLAVSLGGGRYAYAQTTSNPLCEPDKNLFEKIQDAFQNLDVRRTTVNMMSSLLTDVALHATTNRSAKDLTLCFIKTVSDPASGMQDSPALAAFPQSCLDAAVGVDCSDIDATYEVVGFSGGTSAFAKSITSGSLLGMVNFLDGVVQKEPVPVNMAYYFNDVAQRVPVLGVAFAQTTTYDAPLMTLILNVWKFIRNIAYALMAVIMLIIGMMIISRKKINPQLAVTAQVALPKIVIALVLITFSYPIGATIAGFAWGSWASASKLVNDAFAITGTDVLGGLSAASVAYILSIGAGGLIASFLGMTVTFGGVGLVVIGMIIVTIVVVLALWIAMLIKGLAIYFRLIISIVFSPILFSIGAVPGYDDTTMKWFKMMIAYALSIPAMAAVSTFGFALSKILIFSIAFDPTNISNWGNSILGLFAAPFIIIYSYILALKVPSKIEAAIVGDPKKR